MHARTRYTSETGPAYKLFATIPVPGSVLSKQLRDVSLAVGITRWPDCAKLRFAVSERDRSFVIVVAKEWNESYEVVPLLRGSLLSFSGREARLPD